MAQGVENNTKSEVMWRRVLLPKYTLTECNYHPASTRIRCERSLVIVEHQVQVH
jgi:hypothetical protein